MTDSQTKKPTDRQPKPPTPPPIRTGRQPAAARRTPTTKPRHRAAYDRRSRIRKELSAGGVVARQEGTTWLVALVQTEHKRGLVWVLPKGHVEVHTGERIAEAAKREVQEEAGLKDLSVKNQLGVTRFKFQAEETVVHKTVHYFLMTTTQKELTPQAEEALLDAKWFTFSEALSSLEYDTDQEVVRRAEEVLTGTKRPGRSTGSASGRQLKIHT